MRHAGQFVAEMPARYVGGQFRYLADERVWSFASLPFFSDSRQNTARRARVILRDHQRRQPKQGDGQKQMQGNIKFVGSIQGESYLLIRSDSDHKWHA